MCIFWFLPTSFYVIQVGLTNTLYHGKPIKLLKAYAHIESTALTGVADNNSHASFVNNGLEVQALVKILRYIACLM